MRNFESLDTGSFRAFYYAAGASSFTQAARLAGLTQSGVSQHVARLERQLGVSLFLRTSRKVALTDAGRRLRAHVEKYLDDMEALKEELSQEAKSPSGTVSYAMPASCLMSPHFPWLLKDRAERFPGVDLRVTLCPTQEVIELLLRGEIDFGFVTKHAPNPELSFTPFCDEEYILIGGSGYSTKFSREGLAGERWLSHPGVEVLWEHWDSSKFPGRKGLPSNSLNFVGSINSLSGVILMVKAGVGITVVPRHCVMGELERGEVGEITRPGSPAVLNRIFIATPSRLRQPARVRTVIDAFLAMK